MEKLVAAVFLLHYTGFGVMAPKLHLRRQQVRALSEEDLRELREDYRAGDAIVAGLHAYAADDGDERDVLIDFEADTVTIINEVDGAA